MFWGAGEVEKVKLTHQLLQLPVQLLRFLADGPPTGGIVQITPQAGYAVTSSFSGTSFAWYDEDVSCQKSTVFELFFCGKTCGEQNFRFVNAFCFGKRVVLDQILPKDGRVLHQVLSHSTVLVIR